MSYAEFSYLLIGLSGETPLGRIVSIRAENDPKMLKEFTPEQRRIRQEYRTKLAKKQSKKDVDAVLSDLQKAFVAMAR